MRLSVVRRRTPSLIRKLDPRFVNPPAERIFEVMPMTVTSHRKTTEDVFHSSIGRHRESSKLNIFLKKQAQSLPRQKEKPPVETGGLTNE